MVDDVSVFGRLCVCFVVAMLETVATLRHKRLQRSLRKFQKFIGDDMKAVNRRSLNCIRKTKKYVLLLKFCEKMLPTQNFSEIGQYRLLSYGRFEIWRPPAICEY